MSTESFNTRVQQLPSVDYGNVFEHGIYRKSCCRRYREQIRAERRANVIQGFLIASALTVMIVVLLLQKNDIFKVMSLIDEQLSNLDLRTTLSSFPMYIFDGFRAQNTARENYCNQKLDYTSIFNDLRKRVLNQKRALDELERELYQTDKNFKAVALLGTKGVGKTLTAEMLREKFPWPENVHVYSWQTFVEEEVRKFHLMRNFVEQLSTCGQNLLIIDNLSTCDYTFVPIFNSLVKEREGDSIAAAKQVVLVLYIFNLDTEHYWQQFEMLHQLPGDTAIISYRPFGKEDLIDCLHNELKLEKRFLSDEAFARIIDEIDVLETGCSRLRREVLERGNVLE